MFFILLKLCHTFCFMNRKNIELGRSDRNKNLKIMGHLMHPSDYKFKWHYSTKRSEVLRISLLKGG